VKDEAYIPDKIKKLVSSIFKQFVPETNFGMDGVIIEKILNGEPLIDIIRFWMKNNSYEEPNNIEELLKTFEKITTEEKENVKHR